MSYETNITKSLLNYEKDIYWGNEPWNISCKNKDGIQEVECNFGSLNCVDSSYIGVITLLKGMAIVSYRIAADLDVVRDFIVWSEGKPVNWTLDARKMRNGYIAYDFTFHLNDGKKCLSQYTEDLDFIFNDCFDFVKTWHEVYDAKDC